MDLVCQIDQIAKQHFDAHSKNIPAHMGRNWYHTLIPFDVDGETKPLLVAGEASNHVIDTCYMAVLNPDQKALDHIAAGRFYPLPLKKLLAGHCDAIAHNWVAYDIRYYWNFEAYKAHKQKPARLTMR